MAEVVAEGWLRKAPVNPKLGGFMQRSRERWFVLSTTAHRTAQIEYYTSDKLDNLKGSLPITGQSKATATGDANFTLETTAGTLVASAESGEERDQWLERISEVIKFASKARSVSVRLAAERAAERRAREEAAIEETVQNNAGCYLVWSEESDGTLIERWSMNVVEGALARFIPQKSVPGYKYKRHGGNSELLREIRNPKRFFKGVATFCKTSRESDGVLQIFPNKARPFRVFINIEGKLKELLPNEQIDSTKVKAVAVVGKDHETFDGISRMMPMQFVQHATSKGGFGIFLKNEQ